MNILVLNWYDLHNPMAGGAERYLFEIFSRLAKSHNVTLVCQSFPGCQEKEEIDGIHVIRVPVPENALLRRAINTVLKSFMYCINFQKEHDIIVDCVDHIPYFTPLYVRGKRIALQHHFIERNFRSEFPSLGWVLEWIESVYFRVYTFEQFVVVSPSTQRELKNYGIDPDQSVVIYNGISYRHILPERSLDPTIIFLGRLQKYKRVDLLLQAMKVVVQDIPKSKLIIIGDGEDKQALLQLTYKLDLNERVQFAGHVPDDQLMKLLSKAWLHVNPSRKEGWGLNVFEAAQFKVPTVASRVPGLCDAVVDGVTGCLVDFGNVEQLSKAIISLLQDAGLRENMGMKAYEYSLNFTWEDSAYKMDDFLNRVLEGQPQVVSTKFLSTLRFPTPF